MIRKLDRYIFYELAVPFLVGTASVLLMFIANTLMRFSQELFGKEIKTVAIGQLILFSIPGTLKLALPVATTLATALAMSRLARESELTAIRAAGVPLRRVMIPIIGFGLFVACLSFYLSEQIVPRAEVRFSDTLRRIFASGDAIGLQSNVLVKFDNGRYYLNIGSLTRGDRDEILMSDINLFYKPKIGEMWHYSASDGFYREGVLTLKQPRIWQFEGDQAVAFTVKDSFRITQRISRESFFGQPQAREQNASDLKKTIDELKARGLKQSAKQYEIEYANRFSVPVACLIFSIFSPVVAFHFARGGAFVGVLLSIVIVFLYYNAWILSSQVLTNAGFFSPIVGAWLPNLIFGIAGCIALWRSE